LPRIETLIILLALGCTAWGKWLKLGQMNPPGTAYELVLVVLPDLVFFGLVFVLIRALYLLRPTRGMARIGLSLSSLVAVWAVLNVGWLIESGVQLQPGIVMLLVRNAAQWWPFVKAHILGRLPYSIALGALLAAGTGAFAWSFARPRPPEPRWARRLGLLLAWVAVTAASLGANLLASGKLITRFESQVLAFSSHQYAIRSLITGPVGSDEPAGPGREIPRAGQRRIVAPRGDFDPPNVVLVVMESVSHSATSLGGQAEDLTPTLRSLAEQGTEFVSTHVVVSHTTKALWAIHTGMYPAVQDNHVEAVLVDPPYEALPSILARAGYRSGFFQMSKGSFECAPGLCKNLGFDWAWNRENLQDPSAYLGYLAGDDFRMIEPAFEWATAQDGPFLLTFMTSAAHDPYLVPQWYAQPKDDPYEAYLQAVRYTDAFLRAVCDKLEALGLADNTILCVLGDHGTSFRPQAGKGTGRWWPYEEVIRVPWIIRWPGHVAAGRRIERPCSQLDVTPTLLALMGYDISGAGFDGCDAFGPQRPRRKLYFSSWYADSPLGYVLDGRKSVYLPYLDKAFEYDLVSDPQERNPRQLPVGQAQSLKRELLDWQGRSRFHFAPKRLKRQLLYKHWQAVCAGDQAWAYYVP